jgi:hypothetical protein
MRPIISAIFQGRRFVAVGNEYTSIPPNETFHEFLIRFLQKTITPQWYERETKKPDDEQHVIAKWYMSYCEWRTQNTREENRTKDGWSALPCGDAWALLTLAYDLYCLAHSMQLPEDLIKRIRDKDQFQGARYEIAIAATFDRADFKIEHLRKKSEKSCEFIASQENAGDKVGVEVKSRHRPGVLHQDGEILDIEDIKVGISRMLNEAIRQKPKDIPFIVSIDLNLPPSKNTPVQERKWFGDLEQAINNLGDINEDKPEEFNALFITNYSYHYERMSAINTSDYSKDMMSILPLYVKHPLKNPHSLEKIIAAYNEYGRIPSQWDNNAEA